MLHLKHIKLIFFCLVVAVIADMPSANAQTTQVNNDQYLRYFLLQTESFDETVPAKVQRATEQHEAIKMVRSCAGSNQILFSVKANYPHRIQAISDEIEALFLSQTKKLEVKSVTSVPLAEISNFCN